MLKIILIAIAVIIVVFVIVVAMRPADFKVERSATIAAPPAVVFEHINDLHKWQKWSPWAKADPEAKTTFEGPPAGVGAMFSWDGKKTGAGKMINIESVPDQLVRYRLEFKKPFEATNTATFSLKPAGPQTFVTWKMTGRNNFFFKVFSVFMDCDKMIGGDFEKGLADLKIIAEAENSQKGK